MNDLVIRCDCHWVEHQVWLSDIADDETQEFVIQFHLVRDRFWKRVWHAVKYVLGYQSRYGAFDDVIVNPAEAQRMYKWIGDWLDRASVLEERHDTRGV